MKRKLHQAVLGGSLLLLVPGALLSALLAIAAIGTGITSRFEYTDGFAIALLALPILLAYWGIRIYFSLDAGYRPRPRKSLMLFYLAVLAYGACWLFGTTNRDGYVGPMFGNTERTIGMSLLALPILLVLITPPERRHSVQQ